MSSYRKPTAICDGKNFFVDPDWWESLSPEERKGVRLHEEMHIEISNRFRVTMSELNELADYYKEQALSAYSQQLERFAADEDMLDVFSDDCFDHLMVADLVRDGELDEARRRLRSMDTVARYNCPDKVYDFLFPVPG